jgi:acyl carrier protein
VTDTTTRIERIFSESLGIAVSSSATDLFDAGALDSLGLVTLLFELEREFGIVVPADLELESLRTVERLGKLVDEQLTATA